MFHAIRSSSGLKKVAELPPLSETLVRPDANDPESTTMELDERMAHLFSEKQTKCGYGLPSVAKRDKLLLTR